jgi:hypothetical protein
MQINAAHGDASTTLPPRLISPSYWSSLAPPDDALP